MSNYVRQAIHMPNLVAARKLKILQSGQSSTKQGAHLSLRYRAGIYSATVSQLKSCQLLYNCIKSRTLKTGDR